MQYTHEHLEIQKTMTDGRLPLADRLRTAELQVMKGGLTVDDIEVPKWKFDLPTYRHRRRPRNGSCDVWLGHCKERDATALG